MKYFKKAKVLIPLLVVVVVSAGIAAYVRNDNPFSKKYAFIPDANPYLPGNQPACIEVHCNCVDEGDTPCMVKLKLPVEGTYRVYMVKVSETACSFPAYTLP